ncbi:MAG TPA: hypothetical protein VM370_06440 [Candidatus Thermoplasmatota archaeon]|nr:hypothetical protein [Candidatus Thermoplasmatota archaeon]
MSSVTKKVRMSEDEAAQLARIAAEAGKTESDVLREGILLWEREDRRRQAWAQLIQMAEEDGPEPRDLKMKLRFR